MKDGGQPALAGAGVACLLASLDDAVRRSVEHAWAHPTDSRAWVLAHSQELAPAVVDAHIAQIERVNPQVNAMVATRFAAARAEADAADELVRSGHPSAAYAGAQGRRYAGSPAEATVAVAAVRQMQPLSKRMRMR